ncbi:HD domain-containing phosphohydrolase [Geobacter argillaceus]|uniref:Putative nucleotidyltransferase with HDIG domain n=1 Tax=Geobacter argillaceus TaxID=345631 RepID=A0A562VN94_9BACT|nr:HD domain-containing phosphohydrolase [Geobacter argillaceus]TWJ19456.1 putative nucleotidyltransferase with HDIG domain [Geobacter argillaceus]
MLETGDAKVLFVDDEEHILNSIRRVFDDSELTLLYTSSPLQAIEICRSEDICVIVSDNMMPDMGGIDLLARLKAESPQTVKVLMTGYADLTIALQAINSGEVFRFLVKPWENELLVQTVSESLARYRVLSALRREDEVILRSLAQTIELKDHYTRGHCDRVATYATGIAKELGMPATRLREIRYGGWLHDCGKIGVPEEILNFNGILTEKEFETIRKHPDWGAEVARQAQLPEVVVNIIRYHHERFDGSGYPCGLAGGQIPQEARIVAVADVFDALTTDRPYRKGCSLRKGLSVLESLQGVVLDPELVPLFRHIVVRDCGREAAGNEEESCHV